MTNRIKVLPVGTTKRISNLAAINVIRTKKKEPHIVLEILNDYCSSSTLHGIQYLGAKDKRPAENYVKDLKEGQVLVSKVAIYFKESQFLALQRSELYGQTDFLANCGGLLGLFMSFCLLSLLEIIYFLTIRLWFKYQIRRKT